MKTFCSFVAAAVFVSGAAFAQYPSKPITLVVPYSAGGDSDLAGRNLAHVAQKYLNGTPIVVLNRVGASGTIGSKYVRDAAPDGYTLLIARIGSQAITPALDPKATPYKWNDFTFLSVMELNPYVCVVKPDAPYRTMPELIDFIRKNPGKLNFASAGNGTVQHLGPVYLFSLVGLPSEAAVHVPYKGGGEATQALLGGQVQFVCNNLTTMLSLIKAGTMRALMVTTPQRLAELPEVPTSRELGWTDMEHVTGWSALYGPPGMPKDLVERWVDVMQKLAKDPDWLAGNAKIGGIPAVRSPAETEKFARGQYELYERLGTATGMRKP